MHKLNCAAALVVAGAAACSPPMMATFGPVSSFHSCPSPPESGVGSTAVAVDASDPGYDDHVARVAPFSHLELRVDDSDAAGLADATFSLDVADWGYAALPDCDPPATAAGSPDVSVPSTFPVDWSGQDVPPTVEYGPDDARVQVTTDGTSFLLNAQWTALAPDDGPLVDAGATPGEPIRLSLEILQAPELVRGTWTVVRSFGDPGEVDVLGREVTTGEATLVAPVVP